MKEKHTISCHNIGEFVICQIWLVKYYKEKGFLLILKQTLPWELTQELAKRHLTLRLSLGKVSALSSSEYQQLIRGQGQGATGITENLRVFQNQISKDYSPTARPAPPCPHAGTVSFTHIPTHPLQAWQITLICPEIPPRTFPTRPHNPYQNPRHHFQVLGAGRRAWSPLPPSPQPSLWDQQPPGLPPAMPSAVVSYVPLHRGQSWLCFVYWANLWFQQASQFILGLSLIYVNIPFITKATPQSLPSQNKHSP